MNKMRKSCLLILLFSQVLAQDTPEVNQEQPYVDLLNGRGLFSTKPAFDSDWNKADINNNLYSTAIVEADRYEPVKHITIKDKGKPTEKKEVNMIMEARGPEGDREKVKVLALQKKTGSGQNFDDGYEIRFDAAKPRHVQFYCMTDNGDKESCDVRLYLRRHDEKRDVGRHPVLEQPGKGKAKKAANNTTETAEKKEEDDDDVTVGAHHTLWYYVSKTNTTSLTCPKYKFTKDEQPASIKRLVTPLFFRYGFYKQMKVNTANFFEQPFKAQAWYKIDMLLNWEEGKVALYVNDKKKVVEPFYSTERDKKLSCFNVTSFKDLGVNTFMIYGLSPGTTSNFRDIRVCKDLCETLNLYESDNITPIKDKLKKPLKYDEKLFAKAFTEAIYLKMTAAFLATLAAALY